MIALVIEIEQVWGYAAKTYIVLTGLNVLREIISPFIN